MSDTNHQPRNPNQASAQGLTSLPKPTGNLREVLSQAFELAQAIEKAVYSSPPDEQTSSQQGRRLATRSFPNGRRTLGQPLCIETMGGVSTRLIEAGVQLPCRLSELFSTASDNQPGVEIHLLQGDQPLARHNKSVGKFYLTEIPPAPRGVPRVEVTFDIDWDGNLQVAAVNLDTGDSQKIIIQN